MADRRDQPKMVMCLEDAHTSEIRIHDVVYVLQEDGSLKKARVLMTRWNPVLQLTEYGVCHGTVAWVLRDKIFRPDSVSTRLRPELPEPDGTLLDCVRQTLNRSLLVFKAFFGHDHFPDNYEL